MYDYVCFVPRQGMGGFRRRVTLAGDLRARCLNAANVVWAQGGKHWEQTKWGLGTRRRIIGGKT